MCSAPQGGGETPDTYSGRFMTGTFWIFSHLVTFTYLCNMAAHMSVSQMAVSHLLAS